MTSGAKTSKQQYDTLSKASLKSLSFVNKNGATANNIIMEEDAMSAKTGTTSRNNYLMNGISGMSRTQTHSAHGEVNNSSNMMESFLQGMSPEMRRVISKITGVQQLKKEVTDILERKKMQLADGSWYFGAPASAFQKKFTLRKNTQNKLYLKSGGNIDRLNNQKERM